MRINNITIVAFIGDERKGYDRNGEAYRGRVAEISWPDEDGRRVNRIVGNFDTQPCNEIESRKIDESSSFAADVTFYTTKSRNSDFKFTNAYINKIY